MAGGAASTTSHDLGMALARPSHVLPCPSMIFALSRVTWQIFVAHGYSAHDAPNGTAEGTQTAVVARIHHVIVDGTVAGLLLGTLSDEAREGALFDHDTKVRIAKETAVRRAGVAGPCGALGLVGSVLGVACKYASDICRSEPSSPFRGSTTGERRIACAERIDLESSKRAARRHGATLNDLWMSCLAYAMGEYMRRHEHAIRSPPARPAAAPGGPAGASSLPPPPPPPPTPRPAG